jgi:Carboxypeptidase regulatory-like domain/TonB-dependent Receptor Plug Domain/TonB dependent receptor
MIRKILRNGLLLAALFACVFCQSARAQISNGTIRGTVTDHSGAVLADATVNLVKEGTDEHYADQSNKEGYYTFTALSPGNYVVKVSAAGFEPWEGKLTLRVAQEAVIDASLKPGSVTATVTVNDVTPVIDAGDATLSDVKDSTRIDTLPLENSNFLNVLNFSPGVVAGSYGGQGSGYTRVNGIPGGSITFQVDGQSANDRFTNDLQATPQALQTIQELKVTTSNGSAEYGTPGVVDVVTKGGTNQLHGQVHEIYQTGGYEATGYNANPSHLVHNDFGGQVGGPVRIPKLYNGKDKTFFFFDVNKQIQHKLGADGELVPQTDWTQGDFSDYVDVQGNPVTIYDPLTGVYDPSTGYVTRQPFPGNKIPQGRINPIAAKIMTYLPTPNLACPQQSCYTSGSPNWLSPSGTALDDLIRYTGKLDQVLGKNLLSARYTYTNENQLGPAFGGYSGTLLNPQSRIWGGHNGVLSYTTPIGAHAVNEARFGVQVFNMFSGPIPLPGLMASLGLPVYPGTVAWDGFYWYDSNQYYMASIDRPNPKSQPNQNVTLGDNFSLSRGKHELKVGFQATNTRVNTTEGQNPGGNNGFDGDFTALQAPGTVINQTSGANTVNYSKDTGAGLADMLLGETDYSFYEAVPIFHTRQSDIDGFAQDNWKLSSRLTLNLGVRYEYWTPYTDAGGLSSTLDFNGNASGSCTVPGSLTGGATQACVTPGTTGYPAWFGQTQPTVVIPNSGKDQDAGVLAAYEAIGLPVETASKAGISSSLWNMPKNNWAPRLGFAYQFNDKTVIRGGYGVYFWTMPLVQYQQNTRDNDPWFVGVTNQTDFNNDLGAELSFPFGPSGLGGQCNCTRLPPNYSDPRQLGKVTVNPSAGAAINGGFAIAAWDPNYKAQQAKEWNLTLERALPSNWAVSLGYVGNHGSNLVDYDPINADLPRELITGAAYSAPAARRPYPIYGDAGESSMDEFRFNGYSNHNELRAEAKHTFKGSFIFQSYFTLAKSLTTSEGSYNSFGGLEMQPTTLTENAPAPQRLRAIYAPDSYIAAKTFVLNGHYELPIGKGKQFLAQSNTLINEVVSGWNTSVFYMWHSGLYFAPYYNANPGIANSANQYILAPGAANRGILPHDKRTSKEWFNASVWDPAKGAYNGQTFEVRDNQLDWDLLNRIPRNYMTGPGFSNADGTLYKLTPIGHNAVFDLEMQVFNIFNHTNLGLPNSAGAITTGIGTPRLLQFQGKITF